MDQGSLDEQRPSMPLKTESPAAPSPQPRQRLWPLLTLVLLGGLALAIVLPPPKTDTEYSYGRSKVARVKGDMRTMTIAIETYYLDLNEYPAPARGASGANAFAPPDSMARKIPTFPIRRGPDDKLATLTTPIAYVTTYYADPFADVRGATFGYWAPPQDKGNGYILWSPGPDGVYEIDPEHDYDPRTGTLSISLLNKTYDPSNGSYSAGDIYRLKQ